MQLACAGAQAAQPLHRHAACAQAGLHTTAGLLRAATAHVHSPPTQPHPAASHMHRSRGSRTCSRACTHRKASRPATLVTYLLPCRRSPLTATAGGPPLRSSRCPPRLIAICCCRRRRKASRSSACGKEHTAVWLHLFLLQPRLLRWRHHARAHCRSAGKRIALCTQCNECALRLQKRYAGSRTPATARPATLAMCVGNVSPFLTSPLNSASQSVASSSSSRGSGEPASSPACLCARVRQKNRHSAAQ